jgi:hypothetical protein
MPATSIILFLVSLSLFSTATSAGFPGNWSVGLNRECDTAKPSWIWCEDFESDRSDDYFEGTVDRQAGVGINSSTAAAFHYTELTKGGGGFKVAFGRTPTLYFSPVDTGKNDYREIYWRMFVYLPTSWVGNGADKLSRATILVDDNWSQAMIAHVWSGSDPGPDSQRLLIDPASGTDLDGNVVTTKYNDFGNLHWLGRKPSQFPIFAKQNFGKWQCVEARVKLNQTGLTNGLFQIFINGKLEAENTALNWVGTYSDYGINAVFFENYWNNGSPVTQTRYFDNLVISTTPIGCGAKQM